MKQIKNNKIKQVAAKETKQIFRAPKGTHDILPSDRPYWDRIEYVAADTAKIFNFGRIETPTMEFADLFSKTNEDTEMVRKEMYSLKTRGGDLLALRPEYTAPKARAYLEHGLSRLGQPQRLWNMGPVFRYDRPQLGRYRQFNQIDFDVIGGPNDPIYDAEIILIFTRILQELKISDTVLKINSIGCRVCRPLYKKQLQNFYKNSRKKLCSDCDRRLDTNPLRLLDCKSEECKKLREDAPNFLDKICANCSSHFQSVLEHLDELKISYVLDNHLVRGLDYYSKTVFEIFAAGKGSEVGSLLGGGRYDYLMEFLGGHLTPAVGGALGVERIIALMKAREMNISPRTIKKVFVAYTGESAKKKVLGLAKELMLAGIPIVEAFSRDSLKAQLKIADKENVLLALILGQKEIYEKTVILRDMRTGLQEAISLSKLFDEIKKRLRG